MRSPPQSPGTMRQPPKASASISLTGKFDPVARLIEVLLDMQDRVAVSVLLVFCKVLKGSQAIVKDWSVRLYSLGDPDGNLV